MPPKKSKAKDISAWETSSEALLAKIHSAKALFLDEKEITKFIKEANFEKLDSFPNIEELQVVLKKATAQKIPKDHASLTLLTDELTNITQIQEEIKSELDNSPKLPKVRELLNRIILAGITFDELSSFKNLLEKKPKIKNIKSRSSKIISIEGLKDLINECETTEGLLDESVKANL